MEFLHRTWAEIDIDALIHNFSVIKRHAAGTRLMAIVKADAYGHSARNTAPVLEEQGADAFGVSNIEEAITLRGCGITRPILILGYTPVSMAAQLYLNDITQCVYSAEYAAALSERACRDNVKIKIHIKLDTGMSRIGFDCRDSSLSGISQAISAAKLPGFIFDGIFTHFAVSDRTAETDDGFTGSQYSRFSEGVDFFKKAGLEPKCCHCCNSAALFLDNDKHFDMCRPGIVLYGLSPSPDLTFKNELVPVMTVKSVVSMVKEIEKGQTVSYGRTFTADKKMRLATVTAGYADGYPRLLSGKGYVLIGGQKAPIAGRVCMDQMTVDVTGIDGVKQGDEVILFGKELSVDVLAEMCGTINYEIVCGISPRVPRITVRSGVM